MKIRLSRQEALAAELARRREKAQKKHQPNLNTKTMVGSIQHDDTFVKTKAVKPPKTHETITSSGRVNKIDSVDVKHPSLEIPVPIAAKTPIVNQEPKITMSGISTKDIPSPDMDEKEEVIQAVESEHNQPLLSPDQTVVPDKSNTQDIREFLTGAFRPETPSNTESQEPSSATMTMEEAGDYIILVSQVSFDAAAIIHTLVGNCPGIQEKLVSVGEMGVYISIQLLEPMSIVFSLREIFESCQVEIKGHIISIKGNDPI